ncbi:MAG: ABC transporter ATP-binding protein/permease [Lachnospiraceae bacterium]|nr:ABC transporter ATP-binding protein/permease [Lachnospiraceae bacterium]
MESNEKKFPKSRVAWLWENMKGRRGLYVIAMLGTVVYNTLQLVVPYFSGKIVDLFNEIHDTGDTVAAHSNEFYRLIIIMIALTLFRVTVVYLDCMAYESVSQYALFRIRNFLYDKIQRQDMKFYSTYRTGDLMTRVTGDLDAVRHNVAWVVRSIIESITLFTAAAVYFVIMDWKLALAILIVSPLIFFIVFRFKKTVTPKHRALREKLAGMNTYAQENISGNRVVKAFAREDYEIAKFDTANTDFRDTSIDTHYTWLHYFPYVESVADILPLILLLVGGLFIINGQITMGEYVSFSGLIWAICNPMRQMGNIMNEFQRFSAASTKVMEIYYSEAEIVDAPDALSHPGRFKGEVVFDHVSFKYEDGNLPVLKDISFTAHSGETVAIIGETGCGKTSLIQMIPRFYEPNSGTITVDGVNVNRYKLEDLRKNIGLATQDVLLYSDTIEGNIAYGVSHLTANEVVKFARASAAEEFILKMPEGYDTIVGERGVGLSGGQKQRISLARALAIEPSILILDDTTSAVDMETEKHIQHSLRDLDFDCTKIIIAQRISTTKFADNILVLKDGSIIEEGNHEELVKKGGYYSELVKLQVGDIAEATEILSEKSAKTQEGGVVNG